jgi:hypothetical protein
LSNFFVGFRKVELALAEKAGTGAISADLNRGDELICFEERGKNQPVAAIRLGDAVLGNNVSTMLFEELQTPLMQNRVVADGVMVGREKYKA